MFAKDKNLNSPKKYILFSSRKEFSFKLIMRIAY